MAPKAKKRTKSPKAKLKVKSSPVALDAVKCTSPDEIEKDGNVSPLAENIHSREGENWAGAFARKSRRDRLRRGLVGNTSPGGAYRSMSPISRLVQEASGSSRKHLSSREHLSSRMAKDLPACDVHLELEYEVLVQALSQGHSDWLQILSQSDIRVLADTAEVCCVPAGGLIFQQGERDDSSQEMWLLLDGFVQGSFKPGLKDYIPLPDEVPDLQESPLRVKEGKEGKGKKKGQKNKKKGKDGPAMAVLQHEQMINDVKERNKKIMQHNDAIVPIQLFATRTFGAAFGEDTLVSGEMRAYTLTAITDSRLCKINFESYMALFLSENQIAAKLRTHQKAVAARTCLAVTRSLIDEMFPSDFRAQLKDAVTLRRFHAGQYIIDPPKADIFKGEPTNHNDATAVDDAKTHGGTEADAESEKVVEGTESRQSSDRLTITLTPQPSVFFLVSGHVHRVGYVRNHEFVDDLVQYGACEYEGAIFGEGSAILGKSFSPLEGLVGVQAASECQICEIPKEMLAAMAAELRTKTDFIHQVRVHLHEEEYKDELFEPSARVKTKLLRQGGLNKLVRQTGRPIFRTTSSDDEEENEEEKEKEEELKSEVVETKSELSRGQSAVLALDRAEASMLMLDRHLQRGQEANDWEALHMDVLDLVGDVAAKYSDILVQHLKLLPLQGFDVSSLEHKQTRLDLLQVFLSDFIPEGPIHNECKARLKSKHLILNSQKDAGRLMRVRHDRIDFGSSTSLCNFIDRFPNKIQSLKDVIPQFRAALERVYGKEVGGKVSGEYYEWYERKSAAWTRCHELHAQQTLLENKISKLELQANKRTLEEYEEHKLHEMRKQSDAVLRVAEQIRLDLVPLNRVVARSCFATLPLPPAPAANHPILSYVLHLQKIIEAQEDLRLAKGILTVQADTMMQQTFSEFSIGVVDQPPREYSVDDPVEYRPDGSRDVAPILQGFLSNLGLWLFTDDPERWAKETRLEQRKRALRGEY